MLHIHHRRWIAITILCLLALVASAFSGCSVGPADRGPVSSPSATVGTNPALPEPDKKLIPIVQIAEATGWPKGEQPTAAAGTRVTEFAAGLQHPRWIHVLPNGDVLVAESNAPERPEEHKGIKGKVMKKMMAKAGAAVPSANRITLLRDVNGDGVAELKTAFLENLNSPFGMALIEDRLYVANTDAVVRFDYLHDATALPGSGIRVTDLPAGPLNHHWTKNGSCRSGPIGDGGKVCSPRRPPSPSSCP
jgi:glucose/arabinose dehydrogenase